MKQLLISSFMLAFGYSLVASPYPDLEEVKKTYKQTYTVNANTVVDISNKYGEIKFEDTPGNTISIVVVATVKASSKSRAEEALDNIKIYFAGTNSLVSAKTEIDKSNSSSWSNWFGGINLIYKIDYYIKCPSKLVLNLTNKYGDIVLPNWNNNINVNLAYGDLNTKNINGNITISDSYSELYIGDVKGNLTVQSKYSDYVINTANNTNITMDYGDITAQSLGNTVLDVDYSDVLLGKTLDLKVESDYSDLKVDGCGEFAGSGDYSDFIIGSVSKNLTNRQTYGSLSISNATTTSGAYKITTSYTDVSIGGLENYSLNFVGKYCNPELSSGFNYTSKDKSNSSYSLIGKKGSGKVSIAMMCTYGEFTLR
jgi:hypothetical protein